MLEPPVWIERRNHRGQFLDAVVTDRRLVLPAQRAADVHAFQEPLLAQARESVVRTEIRAVLANLRTALALRRLRQRERRGRARRDEVRRGARVVVALDEPRAIDRRINDRFPKRDPALEIREMPGYLVAFDFRSCPTLSPVLWRVMYQPGR